MGADSDGKGGSGSGASAPPTPATPSICADDIQIDASVVQIYSAKAPLPVSPPIIKARGKRTTDDYKAVWACVPKPPDPSVLIFFHGNDHYVTVGPVPKPPVPKESATKTPPSHSKKKKPPSLPPPPSRLPDWTDAIDDRATTGIFYKLDALEDSQKSLPADSGTVKKPVVLLPEDVEANRKDYWSVPPVGQYTAANVLNDLVVDCYEHLRCKKPPNGPYLASGDPASSSYVTNLKRVYLCGHSGGGKPLGEACAAKIQTKNGSDTPPVDLWLFDCTYGFDIKHYIEFCRSRTLGNTASTSRFICIYGPKTKKLLWADDDKTIPLIDDKTQQQKFVWQGTEMQADELRAEIARVLSMKSKDLLIEYDGLNMSSLVIPMLLKSRALFVKTSIGHENIPTTFIPILLRTAAN